MRSQLRWASLLIASLAILATAGAGTALGHDDPGGEGHAAGKGVSISVETRPAPGGVLLHVSTRKFRWAPEHLSPIHGQGHVVAGEGHAHAYVDGAKMPAVMVVGPWTYLRLDPGRHTLRVTLNANDHNEWRRNGKPIQDTVTVDIPEEAEMSG